MLDQELATQLKAYLERVTQPFELVASLDDSQSSAELRGLLEQIQGMSDKITLRTDGSDARKPSFTLQRVGTSTQLRFAAIPLGHEFTSLVLALLWTGGHPPKVEEDTLQQIRALPGQYDFECYMSLSCHSCPETVQSLSLMAIQNHQGHHHRRRALPEGSGRASGNGCAHRVPERRDAGQRPHDGGRAAGQGRQRCRRA